MSINPISRPRDNTFITLVTSDPREVAHRLKQSINMANRYKGYSLSSLLILLSSRAYQMLRTLRGIDDEMHYSDRILGCDFEVLDDRGQKCKIGITVKLAMARDEDIPFEDTPRNRFRTEVVSYLIDDDLSKPKRIRE